MPSTHKSLDVFESQLKQYGRDRLSNAQNIELCKILKASREAAKLLQSDPGNQEFIGKVQAGAIARKRLILGNVGLCVAIAKKQINRGMEPAEMVQQGIIGLSRALDDFDPDRGNQLSTYAYHWIRQAINRGRYLTGRTIVLPCHIQDLMTRIKGASAALSSELNRTPRKAEIAERLGITPSKVDQILSDSSCVYSLDASASNGKGGTVDASLGDRIASPAPDSYESMERVEMLEWLDRGVSLLSAKDRQILVMKYGLDGQKPTPSNAIARVLGVSEKQIATRIQTMRKGILARHFNMGVVLKNDPIDVEKAKALILAQLRFKKAMDITRLKNSLSRWTEADIRKVLQQMQAEGIVRSRHSPTDDMGRAVRHGVTKWEVAQ